MLQTTERKKEMKEVFGSCLCGRQLITKPPIEESWKNEEWKATRWRIFFFFHLFLKFYFIFFFLKLNWIHSWSFLLLCFLLFFFPLFGFVLWQYSVVSLQPVHQRLSTFRICSTLLPEYINYWVIYNILRYFLCRSRLCVMCLYL